VLAVKQDDNGSTFLCSPFRLGWLDEFEVLPRVGS
jgi:hypothetical protein